MYKLKLSVVIITILSMFVAEHVFSQQLIPYRKDSKWGFCTADKKQVVKPAFERVEFYENGLARVVNQSRFGVIDETGKELIPCVYRDLKLPSEGMLAVKNEKFECGYVDVNNKTVIPFAYDYASSFYTGAACVKSKTGDCFLIDKTGKKLQSSPGWSKVTDKNKIPAELNTSVFYESNENQLVVKGYTCISKKNEKGELKQYLATADGKQIGQKGYKYIDLEYYRTNPFIKAYDDEKARVYFLLDKDGKEITPGSSNEFSDFSFGAACNANWIIDSTGKVLLESTKISFASNRYVRVNSNDSVMRYYDLKRKAFFPGTFISGGAVCNACAFARSDEGQEVSVSFTTGKKTPLTRLQQSMEEMKTGNTKCSSQKLEVFSRIGFRLLNDSACFDKYYCVDNTGKKTGAVVYNHKLFMNEMADKTGNKKEELSLTRVAPGDFDYVIRESDTLVIIHASQLVRNDKNVILTEPIKKMPVVSEYDIMVNLKGNQVYSVNRDGANAYNSKGELINTFPCYTCDGEVRGSINHQVSYDAKQKLFLTPMGYISADLKTAYFED
ncbi:MAG TPA: WG repeat-containing protein [Bacteroidia bacterium]